MSHVISIDRVTKHYGDNTALDNISFDVGGGELVGLLGPNGSGKSTLMSILNGQRRPSSGKATLLGQNPRDRNTRSFLGSTPQETGLPNYLTVRESINIIGLHYPHRSSPSATIEQFKLESIARKRISSLSGGQRRKVAVALAFIGKPKVVLLDEPSTGLDVGAREDIWRCILEQRAQGTTILITSHYLEEIEALAERVILIKDGCLLADQSLSALLSQSIHTTVEIHTTDERVIDLPHVVSHHRSGQRLRLSVANAPGFIDALSRSGFEYSNLNIHKASLTDLFEQLTS